MLRFIFLLMRTRFLQLSRYLKMSLATSCDLSPSHDPSTSTPTGYQQLRPPQTTSCDQPQSHGPQEQGTGRVHDLLLPAPLLPYASKLRAASIPSGRPHEPLPTRPGVQDKSTPSSRLRASYKQPGPLKLSSRATAHRSRGAGHTHSILLPALLLPAMSELRAASTPSGCPH